MPIYEYECHACGHTLDALQKVSDGALRKCPACGQLKLRRLISAPKFRLKGEGWYETDFKQDNQRNLAGEKEPSESKKKSDKDDKKSKPADKTSATSATAGAD